MAKKPKPRTKTVEVTVSVTVPSKANRRVVSRILKDQVRGPIYLSIADEYVVGRGTLYPRASGARPQKKA